jgi:soluble lytic murein transglycosylase-like protein
MDAAAWHENGDGTYDVGLMQINSSWRERLGPERWETVATDPCYNVIVGAWILADCLHRYGYTWEGLGCYNAVSRDKRAAYAQELAERMRRKLGE